MFNSTTMAAKLLERRIDLIAGAWADCLTAEQAVVSLNGLDDIANVIPFNVAEIAEHYSFMDAACAQAHEVSDEYPIIWDEQHLCIN